MKLISYLILLITKIFLITCNYDVYKNHFSIFFNRAFNRKGLEQDFGDETTNHLVYNNIFSYINFANSENINLFLTFNASDIKIVSTKYAKLIESKNDKEIKKDIFKFPKTKIDLNLNFLLENSNNEESNSYLGLSYEDNENNFINQLKKNKIIEEGIFSILYNEQSITDDSKYDGQILFGLYPHDMTSRYNKNDLNWISIIKNKENKWKMKFDSITYHKEEESFNTKNVEFALDLNLIIGPEEYKEKIYQNYFKKYISEKLCKEEIFYNRRNNQFYITYSCIPNFDVENFPSLNLYNKELNFTFVLKYSQLLSVFKGRIYLKVIFNKNKENIKWILGRSFMELYPMVFDIDNKKIGFYKIEISEDHPVILVLFLMSVFVIVLVGLHLGLKNEKKEKFENLINNDTNNINNDNDNNKLKKE